MSTNSTHSRFCGQIGAWKATDTNLVGNLGNLMFVMLRKSVLPKTRPPKTAVWSVHHWPPTTDSGIYPHAWQTIRRSFKVDTLLSIFGVSLVEKEPRACQHCISRWGERTAEKKIGSKTPVGGS